MLQENLPLKYQDESALRASIAEQALLAVGCGELGPRQDEVDMLRDAINAATVNEAGEAIIPEGWF